jgi:hypothetical protein
MENYFAARMALLLSLVTCALMPMVHSVGVVHVAASNNFAQGLR